MSLRPFLTVGAYHLSLEQHFDPTFTATLALREKQIQQNYRPIIGVHKWFARRPGTVFRNLLLAEFNGDESLETSYWRAHQMRGVIADPFMGGGTPIYEANRLGFSVVGTDINPMAYWIVRQSLASLDLDAFAAMAEAVISDVEREVADFYATNCVNCGVPAVVKYSLWVKVQECPICRTENDLFPGYLLAEATRHPKHVVLCSHCGALNEYDQQPTPVAPATCAECHKTVYIAGPARRNRVRCRCCATIYPYPQQNPEGPPRHRMWAMEYHCATCKPTHAGRFFKRPDSADLDRFERASDWFAFLCPDLPIPQDTIHAGDETARLHRWGYRQFREMFNDRQLLGLGLLLRRIREVPNVEVRHALLTVFSDFLRYQNMLCRYDTYALKCQDIFSVHGFPVGLVQCENNLLGVPKVGSGSFRHFIEKYLRAKAYCAAPFETRQVGRQKKVIPVPGERIVAQLVDTFPSEDGRQAQLLAVPAVAMPVPPASLDGVFTDPPYFDNVQYAELMDFCFAWLRLGLEKEVAAFQRESTRSGSELTGNTTLGRGLEHFTSGLSDVFRHYAAALKPGAPFVFTYHHNDPAAYVPLVVAILDAEMDCTATLPVPAEMGASLHIARTGSSVLDSVFVCRRGLAFSGDDDVEMALRRDIAALGLGGVHVTDGDVRCLMAGHIARVATNFLRSSWDPNGALLLRMAQARDQIRQVAAGLQGLALHSPSQEERSSDDGSEEHFAAAV